MLLEKFANIGKRIKTLRTERGLTITDLAMKAGVTETELSNVENFRTIPDLPFLTSITDGLETTIGDLFHDISGLDINKPYLLLRKGDREKIDREDSGGIDYEVIMTKYVNNSLFTPTIVTIRSGMYRAPITTNAMEFVLILSGSVTTGFEDEDVQLYEGDTLFYNARMPHSLSNVGDHDCVLLSVYLMSEE